MNDHPIDIRKLANRMLSDGGQRFDVAELDAVLNWLSGSERAGARELIRHIGTPRERPDLTNSIFHRLDHQLFDCGRLVLQRAFVDAGIADKERRARFRRLMTAFHPDHHPDDSGWLTPRSQAIHEAWRQFRTGQEDTEKTLTQEPSRHEDGNTADIRRPPERRSARLIPISPALMVRLRARLLRVEHLQGKALLAIAVISAVPVAWMYFAYQPYRAQIPTQVQSQPSSPPEAAIAHPEPALTTGEVPPVVEQPGEPAATSRPTGWEVEHTRLVAAVFEAVEQLEPTRVATDTLPTAPPESEYTLADSATLLNITEPVATMDEIPGAAPVEPPVQEEQHEDQPDTQRLPERTADATEPTETEPRETPQAPDEEEAATQTEPVTSTTDLPPDPAVVGVDPTTSEAGSEATRSEPEVTDSPIESVEPAVTEEPAPDPPDQAAPEELPTIVVDAAEARQRITQLLGSYRQTFESGHLDGLLGHFTDHPRENTNEGRRWLRRNYQRLFENSSRREMSIEIENISYTGQSWQVEGRFNLHIEYPERRSVRATRVVRYTIREENEQLRIASIEY